MMYRVRSPVNILDPGGAAAHAAGRLRSRPDVGVGCAHGALGRPALLPRPIVATGQPRTPVRGGLAQVHAIELGGLGGAKAGMASAPTWCYD